MGIFHSYVKLPEGKFPWKISPTKPGSITSLGAALALVATKGGAWPWGFHGRSWRFGKWKKAIVMGYIMLYPNLWSISWDIMAIYIYMYINIYIHIFMYIYMYTLIAHKKICHLLLAMVIFHV